MRKIPLDLLETLVTDPFYKRCCICGASHVQFHHNLIYGGRQVNEKFAILPLCKKCHDQANNREFRKKLDFIMLSRATKEELERFSKVRNLDNDLKNLKEYFAAKIEGTY